MHLSILQLLPRRPFHLLQQMVAVLFIFHQYPYTKKIEQ
jgi:hypothetical protein